MYGSGSDEERECCRALGGQQGGGKGVCATVTVVTTTHGRRQFVLLSSWLDDATFRRRYGNQIMLQKFYQRRLVTLAFIALVLENELQYRRLAVCINIADDWATSTRGRRQFVLSSSWLDDATFRRRGYRAW